MYLSKSKLNSNQVLAAGYLRLSREDGDKVESDSISNQRDLVRNYISGKEGFTLIDEYIDDGYSGTSFDRPAFQKMMQDIESKKVNCIIVKDLSRLGRNYIETGKYLERIFPVLGVRFIAINDNYDSFDDNDDSDNIIIPFKNLINDSYCRDISIKIRSQLDIKRRNGKFIGSFAGYGYKKDPEDRNHLIIDEDAAEIVRLIFNMKLEGYSANRIADRLNEMKVVTPMEYKLQQGFNYQCGFRSGEDPVWTAVTVSRILKNELYTGVTVQGKHQKINYKVKQCRDVDEADWIRVEGTHEPIIPRNIFDNVQEMLTRDTRTSPNQEKVYIFSGYLRCPDCGQNLIRRSVKKGGKCYGYYHCSTYSNGNGCSSHLISEEKLKKSVLASVQQQIAILADAETLIEQNEDPATYRPGLKTVTSQIDSLKKETMRYSKLSAQLYQDLQEGTIGESDYEDISRTFSNKLAAAKEALAGAEERKKELLEKEPADSEWVDMFKEYRNIKTLDRRSMVSLIDHIDVYDKNHIEIHYRFEDEIAEVRMMAEAETDISCESGVSQQ